MILCLRDHDDAHIDAEYLIQAGLAAMPAPVMRVEKTPTPLPHLVDCQGLIYTSRHGVLPAHTALSPRAFCIGPGSARAAIAAGFSHIETGSAGADALADMIIAQQPIKAGPLYWPHGAVVQMDMAAILRQHGFDVHEDTLYQLHPLAALPEQVIQQITLGEVRAVMCLSVQHLVWFAALLEKTGLWHHHQEWVLFAPSLRVTKGVSAANWADLQLADTPSRQGVLAAIVAWAHSAPSQD